MGRIPALPRPRRPEQITHRQRHPDRTGGHPCGTDRLNHQDEESHDDVVHHVPGLDQHARSWTRGSRSHGVRSPGAATTILWSSGYARRPATPPPSLMRSGRGARRPPSWEAAAKTVPSPWAASTFVVDLAGRNCYTLYRNGSPICLRITLSREVIALNTSKRQPGRITAHPSRTSTPSRLRFHHHSANRSNEGDRSSVGKSSGAVVVGCAAAPKLACVRDGERCFGRFGERSRVGYRLG